MKQAVIICSIVLNILACKALAQTPFGTSDSISVNNINAMLLVHGDMFWDPAAETAMTFFPKGTTKTNNFAAALWMSGYDAAGNLHVAAQTYRDRGNDYWPGPLDLRDTLTYASSQNWAKIWKIYDTDIQKFLGLSTHTLVNTPSSILNWPGAGNIYAMGATEPISFDTSRSYAPFVDLNGNGIYEPLLGEYPAIRGDEALWEVFSDNGATHTETDGKPLSIEVHLMAYAYNRGTQIDNVIYYNYTIFNYSSNVYSHFRLSFFDDIDLGYFGDDFIRFDSSWRLGIQYNGIACDGFGVASDPTDTYSYNIPSCGVTMVNINFPSYADSGTNYLPLGSFDYFNNDTSEVGDPQADTEYNNYMRCKTRYGTHFSNDFSGAGTASKGYDSGDFCNYVFTGEPSASEDQWSECTCRNTPGDRRFLLSTGDMTLSPGASGTVTFAFITTGMDVGGCPGLPNFDSIKLYADTAWGFFEHIAAALNNVSAPNGDISIYPSPATNVLYIKTATAAPECTYEIHDIVGSTMQHGILTAGTNTIDIHQLPEGAYLFTETNPVGQRTTKRFVKL